MKLREVKKLLKKYPPIIEIRVCESRMLGFDHSAFESTQKGIRDSLAKAGYLKDSPVFMVPVNDREYEGILFHSVVENPPFFHATKERIARLMEESNL